MKSRFYLMIPVEDTCCLRLHPVNGHESVWRMWRRLSFEFTALVPWICSKTRLSVAPDFFSLLLSTLNWHEQQRRNKEKASEKNRKAISPHWKFISFPFLRFAVDLPTHAQLSFQRRLLLESWRCGGRRQLKNVQTGLERRLRCLLSNSNVVHRTLNLFINSMWTFVVVANWFEVK